MPAFDTLTLFRISTYEKPGSGVPHRLFSYTLQMLIEVSIRPTGSIYCATKPQDVNQARSYSRVIRSKKHCGSSGTISEKLFLRPTSAGAPNHEFSSFRLGLFRASLPR